MFNHVNFGDAFSGNNGEGPNPNFVQKNIEGFDMTLDPSDGGISHVLYHVGVRERAFMSLLHSIVSPGMVCWDLGCNIGYTTLFMLRNVGPDGFVYAVDPDPRNLTLANINFNSNNFNNYNFFKKAKYFNFKII